MRHLKILLLVLSVILPGVSFSQQDTSSHTNTQPPKPKKKKKFLSVGSDKTTFEKAEALFEEENYEEAFPLYKKLEERYPEEPIVIFRLGVCYLFQPGGGKTSLEYLERLDQSKFKKTDLAYYLGRSYHLNYKFDEALTQLNEFVLRKNVKQKEKDDAMRFIEYSKNGKELMLHPRGVKIANIGPPVNTKNSEYVPVISSDESVLIYTYRGERSKGGKQFLPDQPDPQGEYFEDIFITTKDSTGQWKEPESIGDNINTTGHDACIALSNDGQKLFIFKNLPSDVGAIYMSRLVGDTWTDPQPLKGEVNSNYWEGSISLSWDERTVYFSSERPGGYGGKDIYSATLQPDSSWGDVKNLGPTINTAYDDDAPFIHPSGEFLIFSSKGHNTMGGYDLFRTDLVGDTAWGEPENLGYPINTTGDDIYYVLTSDGRKGYYSSGSIGGMGKQDIYLLSPAIIGKKIVLVLAKGQVTLDDKPVSAEITVINALTGKTVAVFHSNSNTGRYLINFPSGKEYKLVFKLESFDPMTRTLNTLAVDSFYEANIDMQFFTPEYLSKLKSKKDSLERKDSLMTKVDTSMGRPLTFDELLKQFGDKSMDGLEFTVQIGAYNLPENFNYSSVLKFGKVTKQKLDDGIVRFVIGKHKTLNQAHDARNKIVDAGITDAFITAIYKGKRYLMKDLAANHFFSKQ
ncbi:MAG TPA: hypothetical protein VI112_14155 [Bacteroidia bacterium]|jgi:hypothetical protein